jgi:hypothetical protein
METKFIEGTNQQYSIREDGVVISHYRHLKVHGVYSIIYKNKILKESKSSKNCKQVILRINNKNKTIKIKKLLIEHFNNIKCKYCDTNITISKNELCLKCQTNRHQKDQKKIKINITKSYVSTLLKIPVKYITPELYQEFKNIILFKRQLAKTHNISIYSIK